MLDFAGTRCAAGGAVITPLGRRSGLSQSFDQIVHAVAPSHGSPDWAETLGRCYWSALDLVWASAAALPAEAGPENSVPPLSVLLPLLGAGAKAAPAADAARFAAERCASWQPSPDSRCRETRRLELRFGVQEDEVAGEVEEQFDLIWADE